MARSKKLPAAALVVGIMNLVLFAPCLCCTGFGLAMRSAGGIGSAFSSAQQKELEKKTQEAVEKDLPNAKISQLVSNVVYVLCSTAMIAAAIGLFMVKPWARLLCILTSAFLAVFIVAVSIYQVAVVVPAANRVEERIFKEQKLPAPQGMVQAINYGSVVLQLLVLAGYPLLAIGLLMTSPVRRAFSANQSSGPEDDFDAPRRDDDYDDRRRDDYDDR